MIPKSNPEEREFKASDTSKTNVVCSLLTSKYHLDVTPSDCDNNDRVVIQKLIKETASSHNVNTKQRDFKVIVLNEVDNLTHEAQASLRRTMEKYVERCRLILVCEQLSKVIDPIKSRCLLIRCGAPDDNQIVQILEKIAHRKNFNLPKGLADRFAKVSGGNLREAILALQATKIEKGNLADDTKINIQEWKEFISKRIAEQIIKSQTPETLKDIRERFYELLVNCIPADRIIKVLLEALLQLKTIPNLQYEIIGHAAECDNMLKMGQNAIFHLEAFAAKCMVTVKKYQ